MTADLLRCVQTCCAALPPNSDPRSRGIVAYAQSATGLLLHDPTKRSSLV